VPDAPVPDDPVPDELEVELSTTVSAMGYSAYLPFSVPPAVTRLDVTMATDVPATLGLGLFDGRGAGYQSAGFRGLGGSHRREFFVARDAATPGFTPGPLDPGTWTVIVPVLRAPRRTSVRVRVRMTRGHAVPVALPGPLPGTVRDEPGWYRGDLHCHTEASSDAEATGSALSPAGWAEVARDVGLDFLAMTDHNVISQNWALASAAGADVLLLAGEEMTTFAYGHATVSGIEPGAWLDFRCAPFPLPLPTYGARIADFLAAAHELGAFVSAAHPLEPALRWQFLPDAALDPAARTDGFEVWNGPWLPPGEVALRTWDHLLRQGWSIAANGGSDLHGVRNDKGYRAGLPTTVVYAGALAREPLIAAARAGRSFLTRAPDGVEIYLTAVGPGGQATYTGGSVYGDAGDPVAVRVLVRGGGGMQLRVLDEAGEWLSATLDSDEQTVELERTVGTGGYVRAEVRGEPRSEPVVELPMEALTNPIRFVPGPPPAGWQPEYAPPPPR